MDWIGLVVNVVAIFVGLFIYIGITRTKWGREHEEFQYGIMVVAILAAVLLCGGARKLFF